MKVSVCRVIALAVFASPLLALATLPTTRPPFKARTFHSPVIDQLISTIQPLFQNSDLGVLFANCLPNTLDTTIYYHSNDYPFDTFVITGDIDAMWLRDSMNQVMPYIPYVSSDSGLLTLMEGLIHRHATSILIDPFANAFNFNASGAGWQTDTRTPPMKPELFEGKYEIDSLASFIKLSYWNYRFGGSESLFRFANIDTQWISAMKAVVETVQLFMTDDGRSSNPPYLFQRETKDALEMQPVQGRGHPAKPFGLSRSLFRPSDDANAMPYNIPGNAMMCVELSHLIELLKVLDNAREKNLPEVNAELSALLESAIRIQDTLSETLKNVLHRYQHQVIPYEMDGFGAAYYMDDANVPSLLSLPVLGYLSPSHPNYVRSREWLLSENNPYYFRGKYGAGIGGPHYLGVNYTWHMAITMQIMTSMNETEIRNGLNMLATTTAGTGMMHESFNVNDPSQYARSWFAWANGLFGEMILQLISTYPQLLFGENQTAIDQAQSLVKPTVSLLSQKEALLLE